MPPITRRTALKMMAAAAASGSALLAAPAVLRGRFALFGHQGPVYSARTVRLVEESVVIDMLNQFRFPDFAERPPKSQKWMSTTGSFGESDWETYRTSKAALNMGARSFANRHARHPVLSLAPGWVRTDMGGPSATFDVETSCRNVANVIEQHGKAPGHRYLDYDGSELPW